MKASKEEREVRKQDTDRYLTCPRCGAPVPYQRRFVHSCFRSYMLEMRRDMARMDRAVRTW